MFSEIQLAQSAPAAGTIQRQIALPISCFPVPDLASAASPLSDCQKLQSFDAVRAQQWLGGGAAATAAAKRIGTELRFRCRADLALGFDRQH